LLFEVFTGEYTLCLLEDVPHVISRLKRDKDFKESLTLSQKTLFL
jgi:hypothetical protein